MSSSNQPATQDNSPGALVNRYRTSFTSLLPSHMREDGGDVWIAGVEAILRTQPEIAQAAANDTGAFLAALVPAAQRGLMPGTPEYYLVPFAPRQGEKRIIQGIIGYQGLVELIYRAGAVSSVIVEVVKSGDEFSYHPGRDPYPQHDVNWFGGKRGDLIGAYAYAVMKDGATSKVVVVGPDEIARSKAKSASASSKYSPWNTNPEAMWLKSAARQLAKWVPTSAEFRRQQLRDAQAVMDERRRVSGMTSHLADLPIGRPEQGEYVDDLTGEVLTAPEDEQIVDAELVADEPHEQAPEGTVGGEASVPAGADDGRVAGSRGSAGARPPKARPAAETDSSVDAPPQASEAGPGDEPPAEPAHAAGGSSAPQVQQYQPEPDQHADSEQAEPAPAPEPVHSPGPMLSKQKNELRAECARLGIQSNTAEKLMWLELILGMADGSLKSSDALNQVQARKAIDKLKGFADHAALEAWGGGQATLDEPAEG